MRISTFHLFLVIMDCWIKVVFTQSFFKMILFMFVRVLPACMCLVPSEVKWRHCLPRTGVTENCVCIISLYFVSFYNLLGLLEVWFLTLSSSPDWLKTVKRWHWNRDFLVWIFKVFSIGLCHRAWLHVVIFSFMSLKDDFETGKQYMQ